MWLYYAAITLVVISNVFYFIIQKSTPGNANPILSLIITYFIAMVTCILIFPFYPHREGLVESLKKLNWTSISLGITIVGLEMGYILAYRSGWAISTASIFANVIVGIVLIPIGILIFKESLSFTNTAGILLCILGLVFITHK